MLWFIILLLVVGWALGIFVFNLGALLHVVLIIALVLLIVNLIKGRRRVAS